MGVRLNWTAVRAKGFTVREEFTRSREELGELMTVFYATPDGTTADFRTPGARPLRVREVVALREHWPVSREERLTAVTDSLRAQPGPMQLVLPVLELAGGTTLLLDGNHRTCAAYLTGVEVRVMRYVLVGPVDATVLPDVAHHDGSIASSVRT